MRILLFSWISLIPLFQILTGIDIVSVSGVGQCPEDQQSLLLQLRSSLKFNSSVSTKLITWNSTTDCCKWGGVNCSSNGQVIGLDLNSESISGGINSSSSLFNLKSLQSLNMGFNSFNSTDIPSGFSNLSLTYLNLSNAGFTGQIPIELSRMTRLVILDLSTLYFPGTLSLKLENPNLSMFVQNLRELTELYLDGVNISARGDDWCNAISSSLPNLSVLSLSNCYLSGDFNSSLANLRSLSVIRLIQNNLSAPVPEFFAEFKNLTVLSLSSCNLNGHFPEKIFHVQTLQILDLSNNNFLTGSLPEVPQDGSLQILVLSSTNFSGELPNSIGNLGMLARIEVNNCNFSGQIPSSIANLTQLVYLDLSFNEFTGLIPSFQKSLELIHIDLSHNNLLGPIRSTHFADLANLVNIDLRFNAINGSIPSSLFSPQSLRKIQLSDNLFDGLLAEFSSGLVLDTLDLSSNKLEGPIPPSFFNLTRLNILSLSSNKLNGTVQLEQLKNLNNLTSLDLSYNSLSIETSGGNSTMSLFPQITTLKLASCKLKNFPALKNQSTLFHLDLSDNQIGGEVPNWIWQVGNGRLLYLNLSSNQLRSLQEPYNIPSLSVLDLHSNQITGKLPIPPETAAYVDYSDNHFSSSIPADIGNNLTYAYFFSVSDNNLTGNLPASICRAIYLQVLDLSNNSLIGSIPPCLIALSGSGTLAVLNLAQNRLSGFITSTFPSNCVLQTLDLHGNYLEGEVPKSLANCTMLEVLNLGSNQLTGIFPSFLKNSSNLRVLVLRSNMFHGGIGCQGANHSWRKLQIIDIASNNFSGELHRECLLSWSGMMDEEGAAESQLNHLHFGFLELNQFYYQDTVTVTNKGLQMELVKILTVFTSIDLSNNRFKGEIPDTIGTLRSLYVLNVSNNALNGSIPPSIGNLTRLESLDLSVNKLSGHIPLELESLTFLAFLNLSDNQLTGRIPRGNQFQTFEQTSFEGNVGLCGSQLNKSCSSADKVPPSPKSQRQGSVSWTFDWKYIFTGLGFGVGAAVVLGPLIFWKQGRDWWDEHTDKLVSIILPVFGFPNTWPDDVKVEAEVSIEEEPPHNVLDFIDNGDESEDKAFRGRYCVFCTKLDIYRKKAIHNPNCSCHYSTPLSSFSSSQSSCYSSEPPVTKL